jgi:hypothetical protein
MRVLWGKFWHRGCMLRGMRWRHCHPFFSLALMTVTGATVLEFVVSLLADSLWPPPMRDPSQDMADDEL